MGVGPMIFRGSQARSPREVDYRLARQALISEYRKGRIASHEVCDAHPELRRAAQECSEASNRDCPICEVAKLVLVSYVFGPRLPAFGRCITSREELRKLAGKAGEYTCYVVEVCPECSWNHLTRSFVFGRLDDKRRADRTGR